MLISTQHKINIQFMLINFMKSWTFVLKALQFKVKILLKLKNFVWQKMLTLNVFHYIELDNNSYIKFK